MGQFPMPTNSANFWATNAADGLWDDFNWTWVDDNQVRVNVNFDQTVTNLGVYFRMSDNRNRSGTAYLTLDTNTIISITSDTNIQFTVTQTNIPAPRMYYSEFLAYSGTVWRTLAQGKIQTIWSILTQTSAVTLGAAVYVPESTFTQDGGVLVGTGTSAYQEETGTVFLASVGAGSALDVTALQSGTNANLVLIKALQVNTGTLDSAVSALETATNAHRVALTALEGATNDAQSRYVDAAGDTMTGPLTTDSATNRAIIVSQGFSASLGNDSAGLLFTTDTDDMSVFWRDGVGLTYTNESGGSGDRYATVTTHIVPLRTATNAQLTLIETLQDNTNSMTVRIAANEAATNNLAGRVAANETATNANLALITALHVNTNTLQGYVETLWVDTNSIHAAVTNNDIDIAANQAGTNDCLDRGGTRLMYGSIDMDGNDLDDVDNITFNTGNWFDIFDEGTDGKGVVQIRPNNENTDNGVLFRLGGTNSSHGEQDKVVFSMGALGTFTIESNANTRIQWDCDAHTWDWGGGRQSNFLIGANTDIGRATNAHRAALDTLEGATGVYARVNANNTYSGSTTSDFTAVDILVPTPTQDDEAAPKAYVDAQAVSVGATNQVYGEIYVYDQASTTVVGVANTWYDILSWTEGSALGVGHTTSNMTIEADGTYAVLGMFSFSGTGNKTFELGAFTNDSASPILNASVRRKLGAGGDVGAAAFTAIIDLDIGDIVNPKVMIVDDTGNLVIEHAQLQLWRLVSSSGGTNWSQWAAAGNIDVGGNAVSNCTFGASADGSGLTGLDAADVTNHPVSLSGGWVEGSVTAPTNYAPFGEFEYAVLWTQIVAETYAGTGTIQLCSAASGQSIYRGTVVTNYTTIVVTNGLQVYTTFADTTTAAGDYVFVMMTNNNSAQGLTFTAQGYEQ
jgi:hypothetical protein